MDMPLIPAAPALPNPAAATPGNPGVTDAGTQDAPDFAALLAAGIAVPAADDTADPSTLSITDALLPDTEPALEAPNLPDPTLGVVLAAIAIPGAVTLPDARTGVDAAQGLSAPASPVAESPDGLPTAAQTLRAAAQVTPFQAVLQEQDAGPGAGGLDNASGTPTPLPPAGAAPVRTSHLAAAHSPAVAAEMRTAVGGNGWDAQLGRTVVWMASERHQVAEVRLNPPDLGPLEIVLRLSGDDNSQASVTFASPHADVRSAIESALPRLRDMLAGSGITLGEANVNAESFRDTGNARHSPQDDNAAGGAAAAAALNLPGLRTGAGLVDIFA